MAAEAWDRTQTARRVLDGEGLSYVDRFGAPRARPEVAIERDSRLAFARLIRDPDLDVELPSEARHVFDTGSFLLFGDWDVLGVDRRDYADDARDAWARLGTLYLDEGLGNVGALPSGAIRWALEQFGEPGCQ